jgi:hypothetical protein
MGTDALIVPVVGLFADRQGVQAENPGLHVPPRYQVQDRFRPASGRFAGGPERSVDLLPPVLN